MNAAAAVDEHRLTGHEVAVVGDQEHEGADEVLGHLGAFEHPGLDVGALALFGDVLLVLAAQREARRDGVHADAEGPELARERAREPYHAALGRRVVDVVRNALEEGARGDVDDLALALRAHRREHDARAFRGHAETVRAADAPSAAGDDDDPVGKTHGSLLSGAWTARAACRATARRPRRWRTRRPGSAA